VVSALGVGSVVAAVVVSPWAPVVWVAGVVVAGARTWSKG
jgi:hypothetical protein